MSTNITPFRDDCEHVLERLPAIDMTMRYACSGCHGIQDFTTEFLDAPNYVALASAVTAELGGTVAGVRSEPRRWEYPTGGWLGKVYTDHEALALLHLAAANIPFIEYLDAWIDKGLADGTLTLEKAGRYREAIAARCAELGEVPHVRQHIVALQLKAGDILGIVSPSESSSLMGSMGRYASELLKVAGAEGVEVMVFPPGTEFHVLEGAAAQVSDKVREYVDAKVQVVEDKTAQASNSLLEELKQVREGVMTADRIRAMLAEEIRLSAAMGRTHQ